MVDCDLPDCGSCGDCGSGCDWPSGNGKKKRKNTHRPDAPHPDWQPGKRSGPAHHLMAAVALDTFPDTSHALRWWSLPRWFGIASIRAYQRWLSPRLPFHCRFRPSCSHYGLEAVRTYGLVRGMRLAVGRIQRCNGSVRRGTVDALPTGAVEARG